MSSLVPAGMSRRHFMHHLAGASATGLARHLADRRLGRQLDRAQEEAQSGHHAVDGGRPGHDRYLGPQARRADRRTVQADFDQRRPANLRASAPDGPADETHVGHPLDEHARGRPHPRPLLHAHRLRPQSEHRISRLRFGDQPRALFVRLGLGDSAVRGRRRRQRRPRLPGHDLCAVRRRLRRQRAELAHGHAGRPPDRAHGHARTHRDLVHRPGQSRRNAQPRSGQGQRFGRRSCPGAQENAGPHDQRADGRLQNRQGIDRSARTLRQDRLRPRLLDGPAAGRARRLVRRGRPGRLGHAHGQFQTAQHPQAAGTRPGHGRSGWRSGRARPAGRHRHHLDGRVRPHAADQRQLGPRPLGPQLERRRRRSRHEGWAGDRPNQLRRHQRRDASPTLRRT